MTETEDGDHLLDDRDRALLDFEETAPSLPDVKNEAVRRAFGLSPTRYYQILNGLADSAAALEYSPVVVRRLQRMRNSRTSGHGW